MTPEHLSTLSLDELKSAGLSKQKAAYILDLSMRVRDGTLPLERMARLSDDAVIESLIEVKGIGVWTAHMFLIFSLGRLDVLPHGDYGVRSAIQKLYDLKELPDRHTCHRDRGALASLREHRVVVLLEEPGILKETGPAAG